MKQRLYSFKKIVMAALLAVFVLIPGGVYAQDNPFREQGFETIVGTPKNPVEVGVMLVKSALTLLGIGTIALMMYAGFRWMTAAGNDEAVTQAKKTLRNAVIGLILIMMSYGITLYVVQIVQREAGDYGVNPIGGSATLKQGVSGTLPSF